MLGKHTVSVLLSMSLCLLAGAKTTTTISDGGAWDDPLVWDNGAPVSGDTIYVSKIINLPFDLSYNSSTSLYVSSKGIQAGMFPDGTASPMTLDMNRGNIFLSGSGKLIMFNGSVMRDADVYLDFGYLYVNSLIYSVVTIQRGGYMRIAPTYTTQGGNINLESGGILIGDVDSGTTVNNTGGVLIKANTTTNSGYGVLGSAADTKLPSGATLADGVTIEWGRSYSELHTWDGFVTGGTYNMTDYGSKYFTNDGETTGGNFTLGERAEFTYSGVNTIDGIAFSSTGAEITGANDSSILKLLQSTDIFTGSNRFYGSSSRYGLVTMAGPATITLNRSGGNAVTYTNLRIENGTIAYGGDNQIYTGYVDFAGGSLNTNGYSDSVGSMKVTGNSILDLGSAGTLTFADSSAESWSGSLTLLNYDGTAKLQFTNQGLTQAQLGLITYNGISASFDGSNDWLIFQEILDYYAIASGDWSVGTTWDTGSAPQTGSNVYIADGYGVDLNSALDLGDGTLQVGDGITAGVLSLNTALSGAYTATINDGGIVSANVASGVTSGTWTINSGGLLYGSAVSSVGAGNFTVNSGGVFASRFGDVGSASFTDNGGVIIDNDGASAGYGLLQGDITLGFADSIQSGVTMAVDAGGHVTASAAGSLSGGDWTIRSGGQVSASAGAITGGAFTVESGGTLTASGTIAVDNLDGAGSVSGAGSLVLNQTGGTTWTGTVSGLSALTFNGSGSLTLNRSASDNLAVQSSALVVNSGTVVLGQSDQIADTTSLRLAGGDFQTGGHSETMGTLDVDGASAILLDHSVHSLTFANSSAESWTGSLSVEGWSGDEAGGDYGRIYVEGQGLTASQRSMIEWAGGALVGADFVGATNELIPNLSDLSGSGSTLVMQVVSDGGITLVCPTAVQMPTQSVLSNGNSAYFNSVSETYPIEIQDVRGTSSPITVSAAVDALTNGMVSRATTLSVDSLSGESTGVSGSSVSGSGTLITAASSVNRQFGATLRVTAGALSGASAQSGTYTGSVVLTVN